MRPPLCDIQVWSRMPWAPSLECEFRWHRLACTPKKRWPSERHNITCSSMPVGCCSARFQVSTFGFRVCSISKDVRLRPATSIADPPGRLCRVCLQLANMVLQTWVASAFPLTFLFRPDTRTRPWIFNSERARGWSSDRETAAINVFLTVCLR